MDFIAKTSSKSFTKSYTLDKSPENKHQLFDHLERYLKFHTQKQVSGVDSDLHTSLNHTRSSARLYANSTMKK
ncbi:hypothetical protein HK096_008388 [Nowakowskiella sp. JEL0078]|nr:hypothetical protein HK096_008388 [Nowakowskiella sp. JEL0078]